MNTNGRLEVDIIQTTDEDGQIHVFEKVDEFEIDDQGYALLIYKGSGEDWEAETARKEEEAGEEGYDEEVIVMKILEEDGEEVFAEIEDEEEYQKVVQYLEENQDEEVTIDLAQMLSLIEEVEDTETDN